MLVSDNVFQLINYTSFVEALFWGVSTAALLYLRWKQPERERPIKVNIFVAVGFFIVCLFLVILPIIDDPYLVGVAVAIIASGVPVYAIFIHWRNRPLWLRKATHSWDTSIQKLCVAIPTKNDD